MPDADTPDTPVQSPEPDTPSIHELEAQRRENRDKMVELGLRPYGVRQDGLTSLEEARSAYDADADQAHKDAGKEPPPDFVDRRARRTVAGRVMLRRVQGNLIFMTIRDHTGDLQIAVSKRDCAGAGFQLAKKALDLADLVVAEGPLVMTRTGEITLWADRLETGAKCLVPPPEKHAGMKDVETRYRRRYQDLWATPDTMRTFVLRSRIMTNIRRHLDERAFVEVETPMLQRQAGGAAARPFVTHMNALDIDLSLRIAPELYLKRLLVGGMPRVYEVNRNFRNEGVDRSHNPEFTSLEIYEAYGNCDTMLALVEGLIRDCARLVGEATGHDGLSLPFGDLSVDYGSAFEQVTYAELFERALGFSMRDGARARDEAKARRLKHEGLDDLFVVNELFEEVAEPTLDPARPTFVRDYPAALSPLTRPKPDDPTLADRWDLFIGGMELGPGYTELNDPDIQTERFSEQLTGIDDEESTFRTFDQDFIDALKTGMPPAGGLGLGIDRLVMLLTNQRTIRDVILFPMMRPLPAGQPTDTPVS